MQLVLLITIFIIATCGLIYELVAGTVASYLLGDSVTQFSTVIGAYLFSMGVGSYFSKYFTKNIFSRFIEIEIAVGVVGGLSSTCLFLIFPNTQHFTFFLYLFVSITGILVGLEIPLLMRLLKEKMPFDELVSKVFSFDYIGALLASLLFPLFFVPEWGLLRTALFFGLVNISTALLLLFKFGSANNASHWLKLLGFVALFFELGCFVYSEKIMNFSESMIFGDNIVYAKSSPYQRIVLTSKKEDVKLFLNGNLQFSTRDEYRYHEALVHPSITQQSSVKNVLVLGGGDGLAVREILKYPTVESITLVDLDAAITKLFSTNKRLTQLNQSSLTNKKVKVINTDAFLWLKSTPQQFDFILVDFPDPSNFAVGKLYSNLFYKYLNKALSATGWLCVQCTSPFAAKKSFWCINKTLQSAGFTTFPYHNTVPSFGEWGYIAANKNGDSIKFPNTIVSTKYLTAEIMPTLFSFPKDMLVVDSLPVNRLSNQALVDIFEKEWDAYLQ
jgi:spermidine synthase